MFEDLGPLMASEAKTDALTKFGASQKEAFEQRLQESFENAAGLGIPLQLMEGMYEKAVNIILSGDSNQSINILWNILEFRAQS
ncbi:MAG: hypothetical protein LBE35_04785 [Clostridiales bacterium]|jgi:hypothetical protein|nr:hypothetical protein [Clostridiales bacterium]